MINKLRSREKLILDIFSRYSYQMAMLLPMTRSPENQPSNLASSGPILFLYLRLDVFLLLLRSLMVLAPLKELWSSSSDQEPKTQGKALLVSFSTVRFARKSNT